MSPDPVLLEVTRGGRVESTHHGRLVLLDPDGTVVKAAGEVDDAVYARSSLKPLQAAAMLRSGLVTDSPGLALACASHDGEDVHREGARAVLAAAGLTEAALGCPADLPGGRAALLEYVAAGGVAAPICHNCSGKHSAMVSTCVTNGWDVASYLAPEHPLQQAIVAEIETRCATPIVATSVDGCGAPAHALSLAGLARGFATLAGDRPGDLSGDADGPAIRSAMRAHPRLVGGTGRAVTELMTEVDGLVCKDGAEGVWAAALPDGRAFAAKAADGSARALGPLLAAALRYWGFDGPAVRRWSSVDVLGGAVTPGQGGVVVGSVGFATELRALLGLPRD